MKSMKIINFCAHYSLLFISLIFRTFTKVKKSRIICSSYDYTKYACNPRAFTEYLLKEHDGEYEIYWCFKTGIEVPNLPKEIKIIRWRTLKYFYVINTAGFIFSNMRLGRWRTYLIKRKEQKYIMMWHSSMSVKKVEKDAENSLSEYYIKAAKYDSSNCDLMISGCQFRTKIMKNSFWYDGDILEKGTPRNDVLFTANGKEIRDKVFKKYNIPHNVKILYAPTFRKDYGLSCYKLDWFDTFSLLEKKFGGTFYVLFRLHPNFQRLNVDLTKYTNERIIDVTGYHDMQELISISDILVTDYSSSIFDFMLLNKPCFIYATDSETYDRGTYIKLEDLPFPLASNNDELLNVIREFNLEKFSDNVKAFNNNIIRTYENGKACFELYKWMQNNS